MSCPEDSLTPVFLDLWLLQFLLLIFLNALWAIQGKGYDTVVLVHLTLTDCDFRIQSHPMHKETFVWVNINILCIFLLIFSQLWHYWHLGIWVFYQFYARREHLILTKEGCEPRCSGWELIQSHYRWLWTDIWLLGIELRTSGRVVIAIGLDASL